MVFQSDDSIFDQGSDTVIFYDHGQFSPELTSPEWKRQKCKEFMCTYVGGVIYENEAFDKTLEIRKLAPSKKSEYLPMATVSSVLYLT